jgi:hypothetical protein
MAKATQPGSGVARNLMHVWTDAVIKIRAALLPIEQSERIKHNTAFLEDIERELAPTVRALYAPILEADNCPEGMRAFIEQISNPTHQVDAFQSLIGIIGAVVVLFPQMGQIAVRQNVMDFNAQIPNVPLSPPDAAEAVERGVLDQPTAEMYASLSGVGPEVFSALMSITGEPPGPIDLINLWRWERISDARLTEGLKYSRLNDDWLPEMQMLAQGFMSPSDAIELLVKGVVDENDALTYYIMAGGEPNQFNILYQAAGDAVGNEQAIGLYNQGLITQAQLEQVFGRSRMNPIFYPIAEQLKHKFLQPFQISSMLKAGTASPEQAAVWLANLGYGADQIQALVGGSPTTTLAKAKGETEAMIIQEYSEGIITADAAHNALVNMGYTLEAAGSLTDLEDAKSAKAERDTAVGGIKSAMINGKITSAAAETKLQALGVPASTINGYISAWTVDASTKVKTLTVAEIAKAADKGLISSADAISRYVSMGYSDADANILAGNYGFGPLIAAT